METHRYVHDTIFHALSKPLSHVILVCVGVFVLGLGICKAVNISQTWNLYNLEYISSETFSESGVVLVSEILK